MAEYIDKDELIEKITISAPTHIGRLINNFILKQQAKDVMPIIHAKWITGQYGDTYYSYCNKYSRTTVDYLYCPKCGAKMDLE